jgi:hypothetical protein
MQTTQWFRAPTEWKISWSYDCSAYGSKGNFIVELWSGPASLVDGVANTLGARGSGMTYEHQGNGNPAATKPTYQDVPRSGPKVEHGPAHSQRIIRGSPRKISIERNLDRMGMTNIHHPDARCIPNNGRTGSNPIGVENDAVRQHAPVRRPGNVRDGKRILARRGGRRDHPSEVRAVGIDEIERVPAKGNRAVVRRYGGSASRHVLEEHADPSLGDSEYLAAGRTIEAETPISYDQQRAGERSRGAANCHDAVHDDAGPGISSDTTERGSCRSTWHGKAHQTERQE